MAMQVKLDEALSDAVAGPLKTQGYEVRTVREQGWGGLKDPVLWQHVTAERIFFITTDRGFGDIRAYPPGTHQGILVLRPQKESIGAFRRLLTAVLQKHRLETLAGSTVVATPRGIRLRRPQS